MPTAFEANRPLKKKAQKARAAKARAIQQAVDAITEGRIKVDDDVAENVVAQGSPRKVKEEMVPKHRFDRMAKIARDRLAMMRLRNDQLGEKEDEIAKLKKQLAEANAEDVFEDEANVEDVFEDEEEDDLIEGDGVTEEEEELALENSDLKDDIKKLRAENNRLSSQLSQYINSDIGTMRFRNKKLHRENNALRASLAKYSKANNRLAEGNSKHHLTEHKFAYAVCALRDILDVIHTFEALSGKQFDLCPKAIDEYRDARGGLTVIKRDGKIDTRKPLVVDDDDDELDQRVAHMHEELDEDEVPTGIPGMTKPRNEGTVSSTDDENRQRPMPKTVEGMIEAAFPQLMKHFAARPWAYEIYPPENDIDEAPLKLRVKVEIGRHWRQSTHWFDLYPAERKVVRTDSKIYRRNGDVLKSSQNAEDTRYV